MFLSCSKNVLWLDPMNWYVIYCHMDISKRIMMQDFPSLYLSFFLLLSLYLSLSLTHTHTHTHTHSLSHTHTHTHTHTLSLSHTHIHILSRSLTHTHIHILSRCFSLSISHSLNLSILMEDWCEPSRVRYGRTVS